jgi:hypothetical protein
MNELLLAEPHNSAGILEQSMGLGTSSSVWIRIDLVLWIGIQLPEWKKTKAFLNTNLASKLFKKFLKTSK